MKLGYFVERRLVNDLKSEVKNLNTQMVEEIKKKGAAQDKDLAKLLVDDWISFIFSFY